MEEKRRLNQLPGYTEPGHTDGPAKVRIRLVDERKPTDIAFRKVALVDSDDALGDSRRLVAAWNATLDVPVDELERNIIAEMRTALGVFVAMIDDSMTGTINTATGVPFRPGFDDLELRPDGSFMLSEARALLSRIRGAQ